MLRTRVGVCVLLVLMAGFSQPAAGQKGKKSAKKALPHFKVRKVSGDELTVVPLKKTKSKLPPRTTTLRLTGATRYVLHSKGKPTNLSREEGRKRLTEGTRIRVEADDSGNVKVLHLGSGKKAKHPRKDT
jgi:hypothetical protein